MAERDADELMLLARGGNSLAFDELVGRYQCMVIRIAAKYLGDASEARDITQNSFVEVYHSLDTYRGRGKFVAFLGRIAINQCRMTVRSRRSRNKALGEISKQKPSNGELPEEQLLALEQRREVERALERLSDKLREVLILRFAGELSYQEIAEVMNLRLGTVKSRIFSGLEKLNRIMNEGSE